LTNETQMQVDGTLLAAYEVPVGTTLVDSDLGASAPIGSHAMARSTSYEAWLDTFQPPAAGREWIAVQSPHFYVNDQSTTGGVYEHTGRVTTVLDPPDGPAGAAFAHRTVLRTRYTTQAGASSPVDCSPLNACRVLPLVAPVATGTLAGTHHLRDLSLSSGRFVAVDEGETAQVPFTAQYVGGGASEVFPLSATSEVGTASVDPNLNFAAAGAKSVTVSVAVPEGAPLGPQEVTLTVQLPDGEVRRATRLVDVNAKSAPPAKEPAPPANPTSPSQPAPAESRQGTTAATVTPPPDLATVRSALGNLKLRSRRRSSVLRTGLRFDQEFVLGGRATWELRRSGAASGSLGRLVRQVGSAGRQSVTLRLSRVGDRALRRKSLPKLEVRTSFVDALGRRSSVTVPIRLR
jgi:hypothetical protein